MTQYILLIQGKTTGTPTAAEWSHFFATAQNSGLFKGRSAIGERVLFGNPDAAKSTDHVVGFMRFDADDRQQVLDLLAIHPVILNGGCVQLCEMPKSQP